LVKSLKLSLLALVVTLFAVLVQAPIASAVTVHTYNGTAAAAYAERWSCNPNLECRNRAYSPIANDCTNFVSQALVAGGFATNVHWRPYISNWAYVQNLWLEMTTFGWIKVAAKYSGSQLAASYTAGARGDILMYDWGKGLRFSHMAIVTGWGERASLYASDGVGDFMSQHSTDRWRAPWNYGYRHPDSSIDRARMIVWVLRPTKQTL
jgi:hypothetical protein